MVEPSGSSPIQASHSGSGWVPTTLSMTIFSGHGAARLIAVSTSIAKKTTASQPPYGRMRLRTRRDMPLDGSDEGVGAVGGAVPLVVGLLPLSFCEWLIEMSRRSQRGLGRIGVGDASH